MSVPLWMFPVWFEYRNAEETGSRARLADWRITRVKGSPSAYIGHVWATDAETAIKRAIEEFEITNPEH